jgi:hypothetical protein
MKLVGKMACFFLNMLGVLIEILKIPTRKRLAISLQRMIKTKKEFELNQTPFSVEVYKYRNFLFAFTSNF